MKRLLTQPKILQEKGHVVITGRPGDGKRTMIKHIHEEQDFHSTTYKVLRYRHCHPKTGKAYLIVVDDHWLSQHGIPTLDKEMEKLTKGSLYVIHIESSKSKIISDKDFNERFSDAIIDLTSPNLELPQEQRRRIIDSSCDRNGISDDEFSTDKREAVARYRPQHYGFPYLCGELFEARQFGNPLQFMESIDLSLSSTRKRQTLEIDSNRYISRNLEEVF